MAVRRLKTNFATPLLILAFGLFVWVFGPNCTLNCGLIANQAFAQDAIENQVESRLAAATNATGAFGNDGNKGDLRDGSSATLSEASGADKATAIAYDGRLLGDEQTARLLIDLDNKVDVKPFYMNNPARVVFDLSKTVFRFQKPENFKPRGMVADLRYGTMTRESSRIVITLNNPGKIIFQQ